MIKTPIELAKLFDADKNDVRRPVQDLQRVLINNRYLSETDKMAITEAVKLLQALRGGYGNLAGSIVAYHKWEPNSDWSEYKRMPEPEQSSEPASSHLRLVPKEE